MICDNCIHNAVCERAHFENHCGYKHTEADVINPELKKIKAEFENPKEIGLDFFDGLDYAERVIDRRIAELKGASNES